MLLQGFLWEEGEDLEDEEVEQVWARQKQGGAASLRGNLRMKQSGKRRGEGAAGAGSMRAPGRTGGAFYVAGVRPSNQGVWYDFWGRPNTRRYLEIQAPGAPLSTGIDRACPVPVSPTTIGQDP